MLRDLHHLALAVQLDGKGFFDLRQCAIGESHVYNRSHDLYNGSFVFVHIALPFRVFIHTYVKLPLTAQPGLRPPPR